MTELTKVFGTNETTKELWEGFLGGWLREDEDEGYLKSLPDDHLIMQLAQSSYEEQTIDPRNVMKVEGQANQGACQGHSVSSNLEFCGYLCGIDLSQQLSRAMGYYETQRIDGISGDRGSTISGGVKLALTTGICDEKYWPYPNRYNPQRPSDYQQVLKSAGEFKLKSSIRLGSYDAIRTFLGSGQGSINIGIGWGDSMNNAVVENYRRGGGGHAIALMSLSDRKDSSGRPYVWMMNSWTERWGNKGWSEWSPTAITQMFQDRWTVAIGMSDLVKPKSRKFTKEMWKKAASYV